MLAHGTQHGASSPSTTWRAARGQHGHRQGRDPGRRVSRPGVAAKNRSRRRCGRTTTRSASIPRPEAAAPPPRRSGLRRGIRDRSLVHAGEPPVQPDGKRIAEMIQADLAKIRYPAQARHDGMEQATAKSCRTARPPWRCSAGPGTTATGQLSPRVLGCTAARRGAGNVAQVVRPAYDALVTRAKQTSDRTSASGSTARRGDREAGSPWGRSPIRWCSWADAPERDAFASTPRAVHLHRRRPG